MERQYVAIDLHQRRSVIVRENEAGEELAVVHIENDPVALALAMAEAGPDPEVAIEATYGYYWAVDLLRAEGAQIRLVNPSGLHWEGRRVKNDYRDCKDLPERMRLHSCPRPDRTARGARAAGAGPLPGQAGRPALGARPSVSRPWDRRACPLESRPARP